MTSLIYPKIWILTYNMKIKRLSLGGVNLGSKAWLNFPKAFKELELLSFKSWNLELLDDHCFFAEFTNLKVISVMDMNDKLILPIFDENHPQYSSTMI